MNHFLLPALFETAQDIILILKESLIKLITFMVRQACMVFLAPS